MEGKKKSMVPYIVIIAIVTIVAILLGTILYNENKRANMGKRALETTYLRALNEVSSYVTNMANDLQKAEYVGTAGQMQQLSSNIWRDSSSAKAALTTIPTDELELTSINKYLSQSGNYMVSLAKKLDNGEKLTDEEYENITVLQEHAQNLSAKLFSLGQEIQNGNLKIEQLYTSAKAKTANADAKNKSGGGEETAPENENDLKSQVTDMEKGIKDTPSLIYDGPFSDHILSQTPALIQGKPEISMEQAKAAAAGAAQANESDVQFIQEEKSNMPSYCFNVGETSVTVTKNGGFIAYMLKSRLSENSKISINEAYDSAVKYLDSLGIKSMESKYYEVKNNVATFNFAYNLNGITCYTDLIKVGVAMDNGEVLSFDARGYIMNHKARDIKNPKISASKAKESVSPNLKISEVNRAIIPTTGKNEIATYEFKTKSKSGDDVLVYINEQTGVEEQILILIINENGILTV